MVFINCPSILYYRAGRPNILEAKKHHIEVVGKSIIVAGSWLASL